MVKNFSKFMYRKTKFEMNQYVEAIWPMMHIYEDIEYGGLLEAHTNHGTKIE